MTLGVTLFAYIIAGIFFILTLRGLSNPETSRRGNTLGMIGMAIAIATTIASPVVQSYVWIVGWYCRWGFNRRDHRAEDRNDRAPAARGRVSQSRGFGGRAGGDCGVALTGKL